MAFRRMNCSFSSMAVLFWCAGWLLLGRFPTAITGIIIKGPESDREALLAIKSQINGDPFGVTSSWNNSVGFCQWKGITCGRRHQRVTVLDLSQQQLKGILSPHVGNLSFLRFINLQDNFFNGVIPPEIGRLSRLESLMLANNSFGGTIPDNLTHCSNLIQLNANRNKLVGNIPAEIGNLLKLENLHVAYNNLTGELPASIGNISSLQSIDLKDNNLQGNLLRSLGLKKRLVNLNLGYNKFSGLISPSIFNISSLKLLALDGNQFYGSLPINVHSNLWNLQTLVTASNNLSGSLPESLSNASKLEILELSRNHFSGKVSVKFQNAKNLSFLNMEFNNLGSGAGATGDLDFLTTLTNCTRLQKFSMSDNKFGGLLPNSITNLSTALEFLLLGNNQVTGTIPVGITNLINLIGFGLANNQLTGTIPDSLGKLTNLQGLVLGGNAFTGRIPTSLGNLSRLSLLGLENNLLEGKIPSEFGNYQNLITMDLASNRLTGPIPKELFSIVTFSNFLNLSNNFLTGSIPSEVGNLKTLINLNISGNRLSGQIPPSLSSCVSLEVLYLNKNQLNGSIPASLSSLGSILELDLSSNNLSGQIPEYLEKLSFLKYLNLSYNQFEGQVPTKGVFSNATGIVLTGNDRLCGGIAELHLPLCHFGEPDKQKRTLALKLILIFCGGVGILFLLSLVLCWLRKKGVKAEPSSTFNLGNSILMVSFHQLLEATDGFASTNLIGQGHFGRVYKGILNQNEEQNIVAVKVINLHEQGASASFLKECKALRNVRHRNLVKIISACSSIDFRGNLFKALIYEFMSNGNLEEWLHEPNEINVIGHGEPEILNFPQRLNIAIDVASALDYLHHHCEVAVIHCDLKPSNILLDHDMVAHVGDFGLARFFQKTENPFSGNSSSTIGLMGTLGYAAPEYGTGSEATTSGDVYSFGILLLEIFTRKRPTDEMFKDGLTLHDFAKMALPDQVLEVVDPLLLLLSWDNEEGNESSSKNPKRANMEDDKMKECLIAILRVATACSVECPTDRMDIADAAKELHYIREYFLGTRFRTLRETEHQI